MKRKFLGALLIIVAAYVLSYIWLRQTRMEIWEKDNQTYVIFPADNIYVYYLYRPLTLIDGTMTGMRFHIGQHR
jgi:hypothetical protein